MAVQQPMLTRVGFFIDWIVWFDSVAKNVKQQKYQISVIPVSCSASWSCPVMIGRLKEALCVKWCAGWNNDTPLTLAIAESFLSVYDDEPRLLAFYLTSCLKQKSFIITTTANATDFQILKTKGLKEQRLGQVRNHWKRLPNSTILWKKKLRSWTCRTTTEFSLDFWTQIVFPPLFFVCHIPKCEEV